MTPMEQMISMSRGARIGRSLTEDSPLEAPVGGHNRHASLMNPATRELVLKSRALDIEKFAESRQLNPGVVLGIAEAAMRLGRIPDLRQYGLAGDDAKAIKHFIAGDVLNIAIEHLDAMDTINEAMTDRDAAKAVRALALSGAQILLKKVEDKTPGYKKGLEALASGDLLTIRNMLGENLVAFGAAKALVRAMNAAPKQVQQQVKDEATHTAGIASYMNLDSAMMMRRPNTIVNASRLERVEQDKTALKMGPRLGASPFETDVLTLEQIAKLANDHRAESWVIEQREILGQLGLDEAQVRLVPSQDKGTYHAVHKKTGKKLGAVWKDKGRWSMYSQQKGRDAGRSVLSKHKSPKTAARQFSKRAK